MDARVICLKRCLERVDNVKNNIEPYLPPEYRINDAIDGQTDDLYKFIEKECITVTDYYKKISTRGQLACSCSHYNIWKEVLENKIQMMIILEDDAKINENFESDGRNIISELPEDFDLCYLYVYPEHYEKYHRENLITNKQFITAGYYTWTTLCYIVSYSGAKKLVEEFKILNNNTDEKISKLIKENRLNAFCSKKIFVENRGQLHFEHEGGLKSTIWFEKKYAGN